MRNAGPCTITAVDACARVLAASIAQRRLVPTTAAGSASAVTARLDAARTWVAVPIPVLGLWPCRHPLPPPFGGNSPFGQLPWRSNTREADRTVSYPGRVQEAATSRMRDQKPRPALSAASAEGLDGLMATATAD